VSPAVFVAVALGSNLGDRHAHLSWAIDKLGGILQDLRPSPPHETDPVGVPDAQPPYLNAVVTGVTSRSPGDLLQALLDLERQRGRTRTAFRAARTLDLDLILYGDLVIDDEHLIVPHPRFRERLFVLEPLAALAPGARDPVTGHTIREILDGALRGC
jgi:2-amino-4-hydroxy-6-hydroxymethyldihydropteridine diphosphokinase